jgi:hypothetical protein
VLEDSDFPIWQELRDPIGHEFARKIDAAILAGVEKPASCPTALIPGAEAAGNTNVADSTAADGGIVNDLAETLGRRWRTTASTAVATLRRAG